jgi:pimeloyl-ACP methyl ester carboxylesterase
MHRTLALLGSLLALEAAAGTPTLLALEDESRGRRVPVEIYEPAAAKCPAKCRVLIFGTGYRAQVSEYSFLLSALSANGILVVGVQHDLEQDSPMPSTGNVTLDRSPFWDRGITNIDFVVRSLGPRFSSHDWSRVILAGHSQGGDIAARLASRQNSAVSALVTLDNRRVPLPTTGSLPVLSIRSSDQPADPGVLPETAARDNPKVCVARMPATRHDDMNNSADGPAQARMINLVVRFLREGHCASEA